MSKFINAPRFLDHTAESFAEHLKSITNHTARLSAKRKREAKERAQFSAQFTTKPKAKAWSFRLTPKGRVSITIRGRKPRYLLEAELSEIVKTHKDHAKEIYEYLGQKSIEVRNEKPN